MKAVILGGTGTLGKEITRQLLSSKKFKEIVCFSRDELKQAEQKKLFPGVRYVIGDIRDQYAVGDCFSGVHSVFHLAAIKHIDIAEENPLEAINTNLIGTINVAKAAISQRVPFVVFSNTDKAVLPITTYGYTKALAQNYLFERNKAQRETKFSVFNWGNIVASRGSVIHSFVRSLLDSGAVHITDQRMSRFWLKIEDAAKFLLDNYEIAPRDSAMIPHVKGAKLIRVVEAIAEILGIENYKIHKIGLRGTEKLYEVLETSHAKCFRSDTCEQYTDDELLELLREVVIDIAEKTTPMQKYATSIKQPVVGFAQ